MVKNTYFHNFSEKLQTLMDFIDIYMLNFKCIGRNVYTHHLSWDSSSRREVLHPNGVPLLPKLRG